MKKLLQSIECGMHLRNRRRNVRCVCDTRAWAADPVLARSELARIAASPADASHQPLVNFSNEAQTQRQLIQAVKTVIECRYVIGDFLNIASSCVRSARCLERDKLPYGSLSSLDAAG